MYANLKKKTAKLSVISNSLLIILKLSVGIITNSVSIISEAIHSSIDLVAAVIAFFSVRISGTPADKEHPFGHGKIENVSGVIEAILILGETITPIHFYSGILVIGGLIIANLKFKNN